MNNNKFAVKYPVIVIIVIIIVVIIIIIVIIIVIIIIIVPFRFCNSSSLYSLPDITVLVDWA